MEEYSMLLEIVNELLEKGYTVDFHLMENVNLFQEADLSPKDFKIDEVYLVEDEADSAIPLLVFAISSRKHQVKGIVLNAITQGKQVSVARIIKKILRFIFKENRSV